MSFIIVLNGLKLENTTENARHSRLQVFVCPRCPTAFVSPFFAVYFCCCRPWTHSNWPVSASRGRNGKKYGA